MNTLAQIESAIWLLNVDELHELEQKVREVQRAKDKSNTGSTLDLPPLKIGPMVRPLSPDDDLLSEMLDDTRF